MAPAVNPLQRVARTVFAGLSLATGGSLAYFYYLKYRGTHSAYYALAVEQTRQSAAAMQLLGGQLHPDEISVLNGQQPTHISSRSAAVGSEGRAGYGLG